jgi:hypothetical protein
VWRDSFRKSNPGEDEQPRRRSRPGDEKEPPGSFSYLLAARIKQIPARKP